MTERQLLQHFTKQIKQNFSSVLWWYKIGDSFGGHKKPCDVIACYYGKLFAFEFKRMGNKLESHQKKSLDDIYESGGITYIAEFIKSDKHERNILFTPYRGGGVKTKIMYEKGKYCIPYSIFHILENRFYN